MIFILPSTHAPTYVHFNVQLLHFQMVKLIVAAALFVGRIETSFLAHNVGRIGPIELDNFPQIHLKDILSHEVRLLVGCSTS